MLTQEEKEASEIIYWRDSVSERPESDSLENLINKMSDGGVFFGLMHRYADYFRSAKTVLELGGGQGWASCMLKKEFTHLAVTLTDISEYAVRSKHKWEYVLNVSLDNAYACKSYSIPEASASLDCVFCFAAAHHFGDHQKTFDEIFRVLKRGGTCLYLHEPGCTRLMYRMAYRRVNMKRPEVPEDVLVYKEIADIAHRTGFKVRMDFDPSVTKRGPVEVAYYSILAKVPILQRILPCTVNFVFTKP